MDGNVLSSLQASQKREKGPANRLSKNKTAYDRNSNDLKISSSKVLIVEDCIDTRRMMRKVLDKHFLIYEAGNGEEALKILDDENIHLVISDVRMPNMSGLELARLMRQNPRYRHLPIITLTGLSDESTKLDAFSRGVDDVMIKPFNPTDLLIRCKNRISKVLEKELGVNHVGVGDESDLGFYERLIQSISKEIEERINDPELNVTSLANFACVSNATLSRILKKHTGYSPWQYIREIRLSRAMKLLKVRKFQTIQQVVFAIGMEDASHFTQIFTRRFGKKPSEVLSEV